MNEPDPIIGIDLGTTHSLVGIVDSGFPIVLADSAGNRLLPSVVHYPEGAGSGGGPGPAPLVGDAAMRSAALRPGRTVRSVKRLMGRTVEDLGSEERARLPHAVESDGRGGLALRIDPETRATPAEVSAQILARLKAVAEEALEHPVKRAVITVPAYFNHSQREATKEAAALAGLEVERIINEPTAAALAYGLERLDDESTVAVYDLGGGTFDLSVLRMSGGLFEVVATAGDTRLGGDDFDETIAEHLREILELGELSKGEAAALAAAARAAKEALSSVESHPVRLPFFREGRSYEAELTRETAERLISPILERTAPICRRAFAEAANKGVECVDRLILVGGSTRTPLVKSRLRDWFGMEPDLSQHPDEAVALGAAIQAGMLCGRVRSMVLVDVTPLSLGIETFGGLMNVIIPRNSTIPAKAGELFTNAVPDQASVAIRVLQGEREMARDNWLLGEIEVPFEPGPKGSARVGVQFAIDADGILEVLARDTVTGNEQVLAIEHAAVDVEDELVERMVSESVDYAFEDMNERIWTEARLKSEELLAAVESALGQIGEEVDEGEREDILAAAARVRSMLDGELKDSAALRKANQDLDLATEGLAALLVEAAFARLDGLGENGNVEDRG